jgi:DNA topoisomerase-1
LVGYTISPLLWTKVAFGLSAGRVQSVAVRLIVEREHERLKFRKSVYWGLDADLEKDAIGFNSRLLSFENKRVATGKDFDSTTGDLLPERKSEVIHFDQIQADRLKQTIRTQTWKVIEVEEKPMSRKPPAPFITSTLQQEANRKLGLSAREAMQVAQGLYEQGFITYMRTDSTFLSSQALQAAREKIVELYGKEYLPDAARTYEGKKVKGAQEAHEAIRPAGTEFVTPDATGLSGVAFRVYDLIWKRTMASQMVNSRQKQVSVRMQIGPAIFASSGMTIEFPGFLRAYVEGSDDETAALEEKEVRLPILKVGDSVQCLDLRSVEHETKPPARFTEASLVQTMEREGIGRPSTYASIIGTIIDRGYVKKSGNALAPTFTAMVVAKLLMQHLPQYVDLGFTSEMERSLDDIAGGDLDHLKYLKSVYFGDRGLKTQVEKQAEKINPEEARSIELEGLKNLSFRVGRYGAYVCRREGDADVCASIPEAQAPADITSEIANKLIDQKVNGSDALGHDPKTNEPVYVLTGRYGPYVQLGDATDAEAKPKRVSLPAGVQPENVNIEMALQLLQLPKTLGVHPGTDKEIKAGLGRFGPYIVHDGDFRSIPKSESLFEITLETALDILAKPKGGRGRAAPIRELGSPKDGEPISVYSGKYGPYIKQGKVNASLSEGMTPETITLEAAVALIAQRIGQDEASGKSAKSAKSSMAKKARSAAKASSASDDADQSDEDSDAKNAKGASRTTSVSAKGKSKSSKTQKKAPEAPIAVAKSVVVRKAAEGKAKEKVPDKKVSVR